MKNFLLIFAISLVAAIASIAKEGMYVEYSLTSARFSGSVKSFSQDGNNRTETNFSGSSMPKSINMLLLTLAQTPGTVYTLDQDKKTYTASTVKPGTEPSENDYDVTIVGNETVNGYRCVHAIVRNTKSQSVTNLWLSKDIPDYRAYFEVKNKYLNSPNMFTALKAKDAEGFVIRMSIDERGNQVEMNLVKAEKRTLDASMFSLHGYTKTETFSPVGGPTSVDVQKLQNMTDEERKQYIEQLKQQYQNAAQGIKR